MQVLQSVFVEQVFSHGTVALRGGETGQTAPVVTQLLDGVMAVSEEVLLKEVTQLKKKKDCVMQVLSEMTTENGPSVTANTDATTMMAIPMSTAVRPPDNVQNWNKSEYNETSITLGWEKVNNITTYRIQYENGGSIIRQGINASDAENSVQYVVSNLTAGTKYQFTIFTMFHGVSSTGNTFTAATAPQDAGGFKAVAQNVSSITLQWQKVKNMLNYSLEYNEKKINVSASEGDGPVNHTATDLMTTTKYEFTLFTLFEDASSSGVKVTAVTAPQDAGGFKAVAQNVSSITLQWQKVKNMLNYRLEYNEKKINVSASEGDGPVNHTVTDLMTTTKYEFTLFTLFEDASSSGVKIIAVTAPDNVQNWNKSEYNETSITLGWEKVNNITTYRIQYENTGSIIRQDINASDAENSVQYVVSDLSAGTKYQFTIFSVFHGVSSTGNTFTAATAPPDAGGFKAVAQNVSSITLQWQNVKNMLNYRLEYNEKKINISASEGDGPVNHTVTDLINANKYEFTLFTLFEDASSSGVKVTAVTAPQDAGGFKAVAQNVSSITLQWQKVKNMLNYSLEYNEKKINVSASEGDGPVNHTVTDLINATKYEFTLFALFEDASSSGVKVTAVTAPQDAGGFKAVAQNVSSITLQWQNVKNMLNYRLEYNEKKINVSASEGDGPVNHTVTDLMTTTKYEFTLFTLFEDARSSGVKVTAVTAPQDAEDFKVVAQNVSSITLQWKQVKNMLNYRLEYNEKKINVSASEGDGPVKHTVTDLMTTTKYEFTLFTLFEDARSSGVKISAVTAPSKVSGVSVKRFVTSLILTWNNMHRVSSYLIQINGENQTIHQNSSLDEVQYPLYSLTPGAEYPFTLFTVFDGVRSDAFNGFTLTALNCTALPWRVTSTSIQGSVDGLFNHARATNGSNSQVGQISDKGKNISFTSLYPGSTYNVSLSYKMNSTQFLQCQHSLTIIPPDIKAYCEYWESGYSISIDWEKPDGIWTAVEVNVSGKTYMVSGNKLTTNISGFIPATTYQVSVATLSGTLRSKPYIFSCQTDPRGVIAGSVIAVLLLVLLLFLAVFVWHSKPYLLSRKKSFMGKAKLSSKTYKAISAKDFPAHFKKLSLNQNKDFSEEYESFFAVGTEQTQEAATNPENKSKNRFNNVLPYDWSRVKLSIIKNDKNSHYINANYMPGYRVSKQYIAAQGPLPSTIDDFWRMIWEQGAKGIVMVTNCTEGGRTKCERYWPLDYTPCVYGDLLVTITLEQKEPNWTLREFGVKNRLTSEERMVKHFHFTAWPDHGVPDSTETLIKFRGLIRQHIEWESADKPTVVHCSAGVGRTGTIIALDVLLQQLEKERAVGIAAFVHKMRKNRPLMVQTESQYIFLHQCILCSLQPKPVAEEPIYENTDMIYANATALMELHSNTQVST
ncbi:receptor-type tyrosine-protein phosphatase H-like [Lampris incognitus]|uniref:receptor-type tyrosine-protein phosphatase H-like n=1 Tax=Lampris incognitus TaxID=2546036 RepID=UPI0024B5C2FD|nr:receptor-type tyrosine-protein phosphatase H-like [Lampris incognitus]